MAEPGTTRQLLTPDADGEPDLDEEARFWREWNTAVYARTRSREEAAALAARVSPDPDRVTAVHRRAETSVARLGTRPEGARDRRLVQIHAAAGRFFQACLQGSWVPGYLTDRGLAAALLSSSPWKIGYAPATWTALTDHLRRQGYREEVMLRSGLVTTGRDGRLHDRFRDRLMVPLRDSHGTAIAFIGRRHPDATDDHGPKYLNSPDTELFVKGQVLAGLAEGRRFLAQGAQPVLVEGPMDAIAVSIAAPGRFTGIAPCGTALTANQVAALARAVNMPAHGIRVALDPDTAGRRAAIRAYSLLQPVTPDITAVIFPNGKDPADVLRHDGRDALRDTLPRASARWPIWSSTPASRTGPRAGTWTSNGRSARSAPPPRSSPPWPQQKPHARPLASAQSSPATTNGPTTTSRASSSPPLRTTTRRRTGFRPRPRT
ncbi:MAG: toprim domain-containing protein [Streptosporangiaceae bacterium]|jgi:DNA primase